MIQIKKSTTADTRTCDYSKVTVEQLISSTESHREDVMRGLEFISEILTRKGLHHDDDKLDNIKQFYSDFKTGFKSTIWWDDHRKINRHHINTPDGCPKDVNLLDVIEHIVDCVMAGKARSGTVYPLSLSPEVLERAFQNTVEMMKNSVEVVEEDQT